MELCAFLEDHRGISGAVWRVPQSLLRTVACLSESQDLQKSKGPMPLRAKFEGLGLWVLFRPWLPEMLFADLHWVILDIVFRRALVPSHQAT